MVGEITFDRPAARNAMTPEMYAQFSDVCAAAADDVEARIVVLRGAGGKAFVAGSDISQFLGFTGADDGIAYERAMEAHLDALLAIPVPVLAVIEGWAIGGGLNIAACADLRIATPGTKFGAPLARTVGNCLSMSNYARLVAGFGEGRAKRMLLLGEMIEAEEALTAGFLTRIVAPSELDRTIASIAEAISAQSPVSLRVSKRALQRLPEPVPDGDDLIREAYGSHDFREGVRAFLDKRKPDWKGS
jgi:enoyl-CoA hydratase/carnithine racemase